MKRLLVLLTITLCSCGKADIKETCTMNGFGNGSCQFTNKGTASGTLCGKVVVSGAGTSADFCSGLVEPQSTTTVTFAIPDVFRSCTPASSSGNWADRCDFGFIPDKPQPEKANDTSRAVTVPPSKTASFEPVIVIIGVFFLGLCFVLLFLLRQKSQVDQFKD